MMPAIHAGDTNDDARAFVQRFMQTQVEHWTMARYSRIDMLSFVSKRFMADKRVDPRSIMPNGFLVTDFEITDEVGPYFDVTIYASTCKKNCPKSHVVRLKVTRELGSFALVPRRYKKKSKYVDYWWADMRDDFRRLSRKERAETIATSDVPDEMLTLWNSTLKENNARGFFGTLWELGYDFRLSVADRLDTLPSQENSPLAGTAWLVPANYAGDGGYSEEESEFEFLESGEVLVYDDIRSSGRYAVKGRWVQDGNQVIVALSNGRLYEMTLDGDRLYSRRANIATTRPLEGWAETPEQRAARVAAAADPDKEPATAAAGSEGARVTFVAGSEALRKGDFDKALATFQQLADAGDQDAQEMVSDINALSEAGRTQWIIEQGAEAVGRGDLDEGERLFKLAKERGDDRADQLLAIVAEAQQKAAPLDAEIARLQAEAGFQCSTTVIVRSGEISTSEGCPEGASQSLVDKHRAEVEAAKENAARLGTSDAAFTVVTGRDTAAATVIWGQKPD